MERAYYPPERVDYLQCGIKKSILQFVYPIFLAFILLSVFFGLVEMISDWDLDYNSNNLHWPQAICNLICCGCSAFLCYCLLKGLENKRNPMTALLAILGFIFILSGLIALFPTPAVPDAEDFLLQAIIGLLLVGIGTSTADQLTKSYTGQLAKFGTVIVKYQFKPLIYIFGVVLLIALLGVITEMLFGHINPGKFPLRLLLTFIFCLISSYLIKKKMERKKANEEMDAIINGNGPVNANEPESVNPPSKITIVSAKRMRLFYAAIAICCILGLTVGIKVSEPFGAAIAMMPFIGGFVWSMVYAVKILTDMLIRGAELAEGRTTPAYLSQQPQPQYTPQPHPQWPPVQPIQTPRHAAPASGANPYGFSTDKTVYINPQKPQPRPVEPIQSPRPAAPTSGANPYGFSTGETGYARAIYSNPTVQPRSAKSNPGHKAQSVNRNTAPNDSKKQSLKKYYWIIGVLAVLLIGLIATIFIIKKGSPSNTLYDSEGIVMAEDTDGNTGSAKQTRSEASRVKVYSVTSNYGHQLSQMGNSYVESNLIDGNTSTAYCLEESRVIGGYDPDDDYGSEPDMPSVTFSTDGSKIDFMIIYNGYQKSESTYSKNCRPRRITIDAWNGGEWAGTLFEGSLRDNNGPQRINFKELDKPYDRVTLQFNVYDMFNGTAYRDIAISEIEFYGTI